MCLIEFVQHLIGFLNFSRRAVEVVESDERKKTSDSETETKGERCFDCLRASADYHSRLDEH